MLQRALRNAHLQRCKDLATKGLPSDGHIESFRWRGTFLIGTLLERSFSFMLIPFYSKYIYICHSKSSCFIHTFLGYVKYLLKDILISSKCFFCFLLFFFHVFVWFFWMFFFACWFAVFLLKKKTWFLFTICVVLLLDFCLTVFFMYYFFMFCHSVFLFVLTCSWFSVSCFFSHLFVWVLLDVFYCLLICCFFFWKNILCLLCLLCLCLIFVWQFF